LGGGAALAGAWLGHRVTGDLDLFFRERTELRGFLPELERVASEAGCEATLVRDSGAHVRARLGVGDERLELDLVHDSLPDLGPSPPLLEGVRLVSLADLRASKLTCLLSRAEPRDLVDVLYLEREGFPAERDLELALQKDAGIDPSVLAWLIKKLPVEPLPKMLVPLTGNELAVYRDQLAERFRRLALGELPPAPE
jgi:hypothetical protein